MQDYPGLKSCEKGIPHTLEPYPDKTMIDFVDESADARPYRAFLFFKGAQMTYNDFVRKSDSLAAALVTTGIKQGDRVAMLLPNSPQMMLGFQGIWKAGAIACPLNPLLTGCEIEHALKDIGAAAVIVLNPFYELVKKAQPASCKFVIATNIKDYLPLLPKAVFTLLKEKKEGCKITLEQGDHWFQDLLRAYQYAKRPQVCVKPDDTAVSFLNGGAEGTHSGKVGTHRALARTALRIRSCLSETLEEWYDRVALTMPLYQVFGCVGAMGTAMINHSSCILIRDKDDLTDVVKSIKKYSPVFMFDVPALCSSIMNYPAVASGRISLKNMKLLVLGDNPLTPETKQRVESGTGGCLLDGYNMTADALLDDWLYPRNGYPGEGSDPSLHGHHKEIVKAGGFQERPLKVVWELENSA